MSAVCNDGEGGEHRKEEIDLMKRETWFSFSLSQLKT